MNCLSRRLENNLLSYNHLMTGGALLERNTAHFCQLRNRFSGNRPQRLITILNLALFQRGALSSLLKVFAWRDQCEVLALVSLCNCRVPGSLPGTRSSLGRISKRHAACSCHDIHPLLSYLDYPSFASWLAGCFGNLVLYFCWQLPVYTQSICE